MTHPSDTRLALVRRAVADPGQFTARGDNYTESIPSWGARAALIALDGDEPSLTQDEIRSVVDAADHRMRFELGGYDPATLSAARALLIEQFAKAIDAKRHQPPTQEVAHA